MDDTSQNPGPDEMAMLLRIAERNLRVYDLSDREQRIGRYILERSFAAGRSEALIPENRFFEVNTGVPDSAVTKTLKLMAAKGIIQIKVLARAKGRSGVVMKAYRFRPMASWWQDAPRRVDVERALELEAELDRMEAWGRGVDARGQVCFLDVDEDNLDDGLSAASRAAALKAGAADNNATPGYAASGNRDGDLSRVRAEIGAAGQYRGDPDGAPGAPVNEPAAMAGGELLGPERLVAAGSNAASAEVGCGGAPSGAAPGLLAGEGATGRPMVNLTIGGEMVNLATGPAMVKPTIGARDAHVRVRDLNVTKRETRNVRNVGGGRGGGTCRFADGRRNEVMDRVDAMCGHAAEYRQYRGWWVVNVKVLPMDLLTAALSDTEQYFRAGNKPRESHSATLWAAVKTLAGDMGIEHPRLRSARV